MILRHSSYGELANRIKSRENRIIVYGAGMIGQIVVPYIISKYNLEDYIDCFVDMDKRKQKSVIRVGERSYYVKSPDILDNVSDKTVILLTNSKFHPVIEYLDKKDSLNNCECYIVPVMQKTEERNIIPKVIHYCWFGKKEMPLFLEECMKSWVKQCPDYEIKRWDETNYDVSKYRYTKQAYEAGKFGFVTDVARLDILYRYGGIYLDTDVKLLRPLDELLSCKGFVGTESWGNINSGGGIGAVPAHPMVKEMLDYRVGYDFLLEDGSCNVETNGYYETIPFMRHGMRVDNTLQIINDMTVFPPEVFHPYDYMTCEENIKSNTIAVHYFSGGWMDEEDKKDRTDTQNRYRSIIERMSTDKKA